MLDLLSVFSKRLSSEEIAQVCNQFYQKTDELESAGGWEIAAAARRLWGYFSDPKSGAAVKSIAGIALLYFILPVDVIPDITPMLGYVDDLAVMAAALAQIGRAAKTAHDTRKYPHLQLVK